MELSDLEKMLAEQRAMIGNLELKITDLETQKKGSSGEKKATADLIGTLRAELETIRGEMAIKAAPPAERKPFDIFDLGTW